MDVDADRAFMAAQRRDGSEYAPIQESTSKTSPPRERGFKETLRSCLRIFKTLVEKALEWSKLLKLVE